MPLSHKNFGLQHLLLELKDGVALVTLNRPEIHNAFNDEMIYELTLVFQELAKAEAVRVVLLNAAGPSFCAGADLNWMKRMADYRFEENQADAKVLHNMLYAVMTCPKPVIAHVQGAALGGGVGLVAACDMAFAHEEALFGLSEVRLGLIPAVISPFVIRKIGETGASEFFLTGERFSAAVARDLGLVQGMGAPEEIRQVIQAKIAALKNCAPEAVAASKQLIREVVSSEWKNVGELTSQRIAERRESKEGREGMTAFLEKRKPNWVVK